MVYRVINLFRREIAGLHEAAILLGLSSLASQLLALVRDRLLAGELGAGSELDVYYSAFRLPDLIYATIASFVSVTVLIPLLSQKIENGQMSEAKNFMSAIFSAFILVMAAVSLVSFILMPFLVDLIAPGFSSSAHQSLILLARILLLSPILLGLSNLFGSVTQTYKKFLLYSLCPVFYNLGIIVGIVVFYPRWGLPGIVWGVILGAFFHFLIQMPALIEHGFAPSFSLKKIKTNWLEVKKVVLISLPRTITLSSNQLALMMVIALASILGEGAISVFNLSYNLQSVPLSIIGVSYSVAAFPTLAKLFTRGHLKEFFEKIKEAGQHIIFWSLPAMVLLIVLRAQIVRVVLGSGEFDWVATRLTAACVAMFAISAVAQGLIQLFIRAYYAGGRTKKPLWANVFSSVLIVVLAYVLTDFYISWPTFKGFIEMIFRVRGLPGTSILMLPLAFTFGSLVNIILLLLMFKKDFKFEFWPLWKTFGLTLIASLLGGAVSYQSLNWFDNFFDINTFLGIFAQGFSAGLIGLFFVFVALWFLGSQELRHLLISLRRKFWRVEVVRPEPEEL